MLKKLALTLWSSVAVNAGDATDIEQPVALAALLDAHSPAYSIDDLMKLQDAQFILTLGTETGSADLTVDSFSISRDGTNYAVVEEFNSGSGLQYTTAGEKRLAITKALGFGPTHIRLDVTASNIDGSNKFASCKLELQGNINVAA